MRQPATASRGFSFVSAAQQLVRALQNRKFVLVFLITLLSSAIGGTTANIGIYMTTFFCGFTTADLRWFAIAAIGALGVLPENGDPMLLVIPVGVGIFGAAILVIHGIIGASVVADILDDQELRTHYRQEAMFNAALSFSIKVSSGVGIVLGGLIFDVIDLPRGVAPADVPHDVITRLGIVVGICVPLLHLIPISLISRYTITRSVHADIRRALDQRRTSISSGSAMEEGNQP